MVLGGSLLDERKLSNREGCLGLAKPTGWPRSSSTLVCFQYSSFPLAQYGDSLCAEAKCDSKTKNLVKMRFTPFPTGFSRRFLLNLI